MVKQGIHPAHNRQAQRAAQVAENANAFEAVVREWIEKKKPRWSAYYLRQVERFLGANVFPYIGSLPIGNVTAAHLLEILGRVEGRGEETVALLVRQWASAIFRYAVATLRADADCPPVPAGCGIAAGTAYPHWRATLAVAQLPPSENLYDRNDIEPGA